MNPTRDTCKRTLTLLAATLVACSLLTMAVAPAAADDIGEAVTDSDDDSWTDRFGSGLVTAAEHFNAVRQATADLNPVVDTDTTAEDQADAVQETFNNDSADWVNWYASQGYPATDEVEVIELRFDDGDDVAERYLIVDYDANSDEYTSAEIVEDTNRDVDEWIEVDGPLVATVDSMWEDRLEAAELLDKVHAEFVTEDRHIGEDTSFLTEMARNYAGHVEVSDRLDPETSIDEGGD